MTHEEFTTQLNNGDITFDDVYDWSLYMDLDWASDVYSRDGFYDHVSECAYDIVSDYGWIDAAYRFRDLLEDWDNEYPYYDWSCSWGEMGFNRDSERAHDFIEQYEDYMTSHNLWSTAATTTVNTKSNDDIWVPEFMFID